jgi:hypothetical protein
VADPQLSKRGKNSAKNDVTLQTLENLSKAQDTYIPSFSEINILAGEDTLNMDSNLEKS